MLLPSGLLVPIAGTDQSHEYHAHSEHYYLTGTALPGSVLAFDPTEGWTLFAPLPSLEERIWVGDGESVDTARERSGIDTVRPVSGLRAWLERHRGQPLAIAGNDDLLRNPEGYAIASWPALEVAIDHEASAWISTRIAEARRAKDPAELALMRGAAGATRAGHLAAMRLARPGMTERQLQVEVEAEFFRTGSARTAYGSIVGGGPNAAVLHFSPTARPFAGGELILMDAAAEYEAYAADVTRTFPVDARFAGPQRDIYELVYRVQQAAIEGVRPGKEFRELHLEACAGIAQGLVDLGILRGQPEDLVDQDAHALFFVHGLGHMLGLATHDAGGCLAGRLPSDRLGLKWLRADLPLQEDYVVTIEPGIYFIKAVFEDPELRRKYRDAVNWSLVDTFADFGGVRIEDDVRVTASGHEVLSAAIPSRLDEIEALRREALTS